MGLINNFVLLYFIGKYQGNLYLLAKLLLPAKEKRIYNIKDKQILKYFSQV